MAAATGFVEDDVDHRRKRNNLEVEPSKNTNGRVSVSEPLAVPEGHRAIVTAMEIGLIRDVVDRALMFHENMFHETVVGENNIFGKTYNFCFSSVYKTVSVADTVVKSTDKIYQDTFPGFIVNRTNAAQKAVWTKWVTVDDTVSTSVSYQLSKHPFFRKSTAEVLRDLKKSVEETKIWKFGENVVEVVADFARKIKPGKGPETNDDTDPDNSDENDGAAKNESQPKIPARGLTAGARASVDQAHTGDEQKEGQ